jgi:hypothetical protein
MSLFGAERIGCPEVLASLVFIIEDAIDQVERPDDVRNHITDCPHCSRQLEHERMTHAFLVDALRRSCTEKAPASLYESIHNQLVGAAANTEVVTTFSMTEISIEIDEFGNVEHREIQIEQTHIQQINFDGDLPGNDGEHGGKIS